MKRYSKAAVVGILLLAMVGGCSREEKSTRMVAGERKVETVSETALETEKAPEVKKEEIRRLQVVREGQTSYELTYHPVKDRDSYLYWEMTIPYQSYATVDTEAMYNLYGVIEGINLSKAKKGVKESESHLLKSRTSITIEYTKNKKAESPDKMETLIVGKRTKENQYYCALKGYEDECFLVDAFSIDTILGKKPYDMILKVPYLINVASVERVGIAFGAKCHTMEQKEGEYRLDGKNVSQKSYCNLYSRLLELMITGEIPEGVEAGKDQTPILTMEYERVTKDLVPYTVKLFSYDDSHDFIQVNGTEFFFVDHAEVENLIATLKGGF